MVLTSCSTDGGCQEWDSESTGVCFGGSVGSQDCGCRWERGRGETPR